MTIRVIHIVESVIPKAGTVSVCLPGLLAALRPLGVDGIMIDSIQQWESESAASQTVHIHGWNYPLALHAARSAKRDGKPYVLSPLGRLTPGEFNRVGMTKKLKNFLTQRSFQGNAAAITSLNDVDHRALSSAKLHSNVVMLPYGIDFRDFEEADLAAPDSKSPRNLLMLGPLDPVLGCVVLLKAMAELTTIDAPWSVTLAGEDRGGWRGQLEAAVRRKGGEGRVLFDDPKNLDDQKQLLRAAYVLAAPSLHVSPSVSIMQALAAGVPVIASSNAAPPGLNGEIHICGSSRAQVRQALQSVLDVEPALRRDRLTLAKEKARSMFDWSVLAPRYAELYRSCIRN